MVDRDLSAGFQFYLALLLLQQLDWLLFGSDEVHAAIRTGRGALFHGAMFGSGATSDSSAINFAARVTTFRRSHGGAGLLQFWCAGHITPLHDSHRHRELRFAVAGE